jgi:DNA-binding transcriptional LysR family regulator
LTFTGRNCSCHSQPFTHLRRPGVSGGEVHGMEHVTAVELHASCPQNLPRSLAAFERRSPNVRFRFRPPKRSIQLPDFDIALRGSIHNVMLSRWVEYAVGSPCCSETSPPTPLVSEDGNIHSVFLIISGITSIYQSICPRSKV